MATNTTTGLMLQEMQKRFDAQLAQGVGERSAGEFRTINGYLDRLDRRREAINADPELTGRGKAMRLLSAAKEGLPDLIAAGSKLDATYNSLMRERKKEVLGGETDASDIVAALQRIEARQWLRSLSPTERMARLQSSEDPLLVQAALENPEMAGTDADTVAALAEEKAVRTGNQKVQGIDRELDQLGVAAALLDATKHRVNEWAVQPALGGMGSDGQQAVQELALAGGFVESVTAPEFAGWLQRGTMSLIAPDDDAKQAA